MAAKGESEAEISIYSAIGGDDINAKAFADDLKALDVDTIHLRINSPGGSVIDGIAIFNALQRHKAKVVTHIDGLAASMASVVAMAGDEVRMADNALFMVHNPWTITMGNADELRADADLLDKMAASIKVAYGRSQYNVDEIKDLMDAETWMTAQEALDAGFVDVIEGGLRAAASIVDMAQGFEIQVPTDKIIASMTAKIDAVAKQRDEIKAQLDTQSLELVDARAEVEAAQLAKVEAEEHLATAEARTAELDSLLEDKEADIAEAKEVSAAKIAQAAAELMQNASHAPVADRDEVEVKKLSDDEFWAEYKRIGDENGLDAKNLWYAENKHRKI